MKVRDLVEKLRDLEQDLEVCCYTEDENMLGEGQLFRLLDTESVSVIEGEWCRDSSGVPGLRLGKSPSSRKIASIHVTSVF
jgi:hypothetical protein